MSWKHLASGYWQMQVKEEDRPKTTFSTHHGQFQWVRMHIRPVLKELHWLPVEQRITFKVLLLTFKALNNLAPPHLSQLIVPYNPTRNLRSAGKHLLEVPNVRLKSYGDRAFSVAAPKQWNDIPLDIKLSGSVDVFKSRLKTYLFRLAFI